MAAIAPLPELDWVVLRTMDIRDYLAVRRLGPMQQARHDEFVRRFYMRDFGNRFQPSKELDLARRLRAMYWDSATNKLAVYTLAGVALRWISLLIQHQRSLEWHGLPAWNLDAPAALLEGREPASRKRSIMGMLARDLYERDRDGAAPLMHVMRNVHIDQGKPPVLKQTMFIVDPPADFGATHQLITQTVDPSNLVYGKLVAAPGAKIGMAPSDEGFHLNVIGLPDTTMLDATTGRPVYGAQMMIVRHRTTTYFHLMMRTIDVDYLTDWMREARPADTIRGSWDLQLRERGNGASGHEAYEYVFKESGLLSQFLRRFLYPASLPMPQPADDDDMAIARDYPLSTLIAEVRAMFRLPPDETGSLVYVDSHA